MQNTEDLTQIMKLLAETLVEKIDALGQGREAIEHIGQDNFKALMDLTR